MSLTEQALKFEGLLIEKIQTNMGAYMITKHWLDEYMKLIKTQIDPKMPPICNLDLM